MAASISPEQKLRRSVLSHFLWENEYYEDGEQISDRIAQLIPQVAPEKVAALAIEAREDMKLRHVPLFIAREMVRHESMRPLVRKTLSRIIQRADEMGEFLALYWKDQPNAPIASQVKKGLAEAFGKFDAYQLAKYNSGSIRPRDIMFLTHAKPTAEREELYRKLANKQLESPDTWEVALSSGANKKESWERLIRDRKLGALALIRNLRNMLSVGVDEALIRNALENMKIDRILLKTHPSITGVNRINWSPSSRASEGFKE